MYTVLLPIDISGDIHSADTYLDIMISVVVIQASVLR